MAQLNFTVGAPNISCTPRPLPDTRLVASTVFLSMAFLLGFPGNMALIILKLKRERMSSLGQSLMLNLAMSDLLSLLFLPLWIYTLWDGWMFGLVACRILLYLFYCCVYGSLLTVTALSVQRYIQVLDVRRSPEQGKKRLLALLWLVAMMLSIPASLFSELRTYEGRIPTQCRLNFTSPSQQVPVLLTESITGFASFVVVALAYVGLHRKVNRAAFFNIPQKTRVLTAIIVTSFAIWIPYLILNVLYIAGILLEDSSLIKIDFQHRGLFQSLTFVNSCLNPFLYAFASRNMRTACQIWKTKFCCFLHSMTGKQSQCPINTIENATQQ